MKWFILLVGIVVLCLVVAMILGLLGNRFAGTAKPTSTLSHEPLPEQGLRDQDFDELVFDVALRGYRMSQVDAVIDRVRRELRDRDEEIAVLRGGSPESSEPSEPPESSEPPETPETPRGREPEVP